MNESKAFQIELGENPLLRQITQLEEQFPLLDQRIQEYQDAGLDTSQLESLRAGAEQALADARESVDADALKELALHVQYAADALSAAETMLGELGSWKLLGDYKWILMAIAIIAIITAYLLLEVVAPFVRLGREILRLSGEEKTLVQTRIETEKQYFNRQIDEPTFTKILTDGQAKILRARSELKEAREKRASLLKERLSPRALGSWLARGVLKARRLHRIAARAGHEPRPLAVKRAQFRKFSFRKEGFWRVFGAAAKGGPEKGKPAAPAPKKGKQKGFWKAFGR